MRRILVETTDEQFVLSIDKKLIGKETLMQFVEQLEIELLANQVDFDEDIEQLGEEIKADWWQRNKADLLRGQTEVSL